MKGVFVTATGTDVGKTFVAAGIIRAARARGIPAGAIKPVMSGYDPQYPAESDAGRLLQAMGIPVEAETIAAISPWRYTAAISPDMAAARENRVLPWQDMLNFCRIAIEEAPGLLLLEGAGGAMAPLDAAHTVRDWIDILQLPALLVAGTYLGTISHTLTCAEALLRRGGRIAAIVLSESAHSPVPPEETAACINRFLPGLAIQIIPRDPEVPAFASLTALLTRS